MFIFAATMKRLVTYMLMMLLGTTVLSSCSVEMFDAEVDINESGQMRHLFISGMVTDTESGKALEDITINFKAYLQSKPDSAPVLSDEVYTGNKGTFTIQTPKTYAGSLICTLTASDPKGYYTSHTKQIIVTWKGTSYDKELQMYAVNDCNFQLRKAE